MLPCLGPLPAPHSAPSLTRQCLSPWVSLEPRRGMWLLCRGSGALPWLYCWAQHSPCQAWPRGTARPSRAQSASKLVLLSPPLPFIPMGAEALMFWQAGLTIPRSRPPFPSILLVSCGSGIYFQVNGTAYEDMPLLQGYRAALGTLAAWMQELQEKNVTTVWRTYVPTHFLSVLPQQQPGHIQFTARATRENHACV